MGKCYIHSVCGHSKDTNQFSDNHAKWSNTIRICLSCRVSTKVYTKSLVLTVNGRSVLVLDLLQKCASIAEGLGNLMRAATYLNRGFGSG